MTERNQNPGRKWGGAESNDDQERYYDTFRYTPYTTDLEFFKDGTIYETDVARSTQDNGMVSQTEIDQTPLGNNRPDERIKEEVRKLLNWSKQIDATEMQVDVRDGVVTLSGNVNSRDEKHTAEKMTENVLGVLDIDNQLNIKK